MRSMISTFLGARRDLTQVQDSRSAIISTLRLNTWRSETFWPSGMTQWSFSVKYSTRPKNARQVTTCHHISTFRSNTGHSRTWIHTHHTGYSTSLHSSCAAYTDSHNTACYSDCQSTATIKAFIKVSTANFLCSCGWPAARWFSTHLQLQLHNRRKVNTTLMDYPVSLELFQVYYSTSTSTHHSHFHPLKFNQHHHQCHLPLIKNSEDLPASPASRDSPNQWISPHKSQPNRPF